MVLNKTFKHTGIPKFYKNKETFGDIDIIVCTDGFNGNLREYIQENFNPNEIFHNGNCWSFDYNKIQIDFITTPEKDFNSMLEYMGYNDLGNFIGCMSRGLGLKYGQEGLYYKHMFKGLYIGEILISKDLKKIYEFLGLSYEKLEEGFDELEDIFKFVSNCKYFNWKRFQLTELNKMNRERNLKRKSYMSFLEWIDANVADDNHLYNTKSKTQEEYNEMVINFFPECDFEFYVRKLEYEHTKSLYIKAKFNGGDVMRKYGYKGKELGDVLNGFRTFCKQIHGNDSETFENFILQNSKTVIYDLFERFLRVKENYL